MQFVFVFVFVFVKDSCIQLTAQMTEHAKHFSYVFYDLVVKLSLFNLLEAFTFISLWQSTLASHENKVEIFADAIKGCP